MSPTVAGGRFGSGTLSLPSHGSLGSVSHHTAKLAGAEVVWADVGSNDREHHTEGDEYVLPTPIRGERHLVLRRPTRARSTG